MTVAPLNRGLLRFVRRSRDQSVDQRTGEMPTASEMKWSGLLRFQKSNQLNREQNPSFLKEFHKCTHKTRVVGWYRADNSGATKLIKSSASSLALSRPSVSRGRGKEGSVGSMREL